MKITLYGKCVFWALDVTKNVYYDFFFFSFLGTKMRKRMNCTLYEKNKKKIEQYKKKKRILSVFLIVNYRNGKMRFSNWRNETRFPGTCLLSVLSLLDIKMLKSMEITLYRNIKHYGKQVF